VYVISESESEDEGEDDTQTPQMKNKKIEPWERSKGSIFSGGKKLEDLPKLAPGREEELIEEIEDFLD
jgi:hypothetical protein